jgi:hypothetical protein
MTQQLSPFFVIGENYADRLGEYRVVSLEGIRIVFELNTEELRFRAARRVL